ncbi:gamma carbonic anhydrase family protein [uncultured Ferrovibrio sp.]|uniref:gamma carbonic anhydrase family protein n=1 Tax=uncultured Ferrovibrio sp. TaxID=1576913 RepID=UPI00260B32C6|nr:gamma carbonic anhydrase family protein [uncultured Ferrovibrio sp.]
MKPLLLPFGDKTPVIAPDVFVAPNATVIGDTEIGAGSSIWFGCVLRGDVNSIRIGAGTNIQDGSIVHVTRARYATVIGSGVTIGHLALIHGCRLEDNSFVGMQATVMDGCVIESEGMLAAGALLTPGKRIGRGELWAGRPAKLMRRLDTDELQNIYNTAAHYAKLAASYRDQLASGL